MNRKALPNEVVFQYEQNFVVPVSATNPDGTPYVGRAEGSNGSADWWGSFVEGRPHGQFQIYSGGMHGGPCTFENGRPVELKSKVGP